MIGNAAVASPAAADTEARSPLASSSGSPARCRRRVGQRDEHAGDSVATRLLPPALEPDALVGARDGNHAPIGESRNAQESFTGMVSGLVSAQEPIPRPPHPRAPLGGRRRRLSIARLETVMCICMRGCDDLAGGADSENYVPSETKSFRRFAAGWSPEH